MKIKVVGDNIMQKMKFETAKKILTKRAEEFYGKTLEWLINQMDNGFDENQTIMKCYKVFKQGKK
tara:strand:+ start:1006 stop:1200 length:195 start_codon:yes stop_codon:yes gene_type:complete